LERTQQRKLYLPLIDKVLKKSYVCKVFLIKNEGRKVFCQRLQIQLFAASNKIFFEFLQRGHEMHVQKLFTSLVFDLLFKIFGITSL